MFRHSVTSESRCELNYLTISYSYGSVEIFLNTRFTSVKNKWSLVKDVYGCVLSAAVVFLDL